MSESLAPLAFEGLSEREVTSRRNRFGSNSQTGGSTSSLIDSLREIFAEPMFLLLTVALALYLWLGQYAEGAMMAFGITVVTSISLYQERKSRAALALLRALTAAKVRVIREGHEQWRESEDLVVGDVIHLTEGEVVPADCRVLQANDCSVNEALLTGESLPVPKEAQGAAELYKGTHLVGGQGYLEVTGVGEHTRLGAIDRRFQDLARARSPMDAAVRQFVHTMALVGAATFLLVVGVHWLQTGELLHALMTGLALTMAILPEEIPVAFSVFMALGAKRLAERGVLVREPHALETLASVTTICLDKTGTLTRNEMEVAATLTYPSLEVTEPIVAPTRELDERTRSLLAYAMWASEVEPFDPMEQAIHHAYEKNTAQDERARFTLVKEYPLAGSPPSMTHVFESQEGDRVIACKGALEAVLSLAEVTPGAAADFHSQVDELSRRGLRVLAVARGEVPALLPDSPKEIRFALLGAVALRDPVRASAPPLIARLNALGVRPVMVTGDAAETAAEVARQANLAHGEPPITGGALHALQDDERAEALSRHNVLARIDPELKLELVEALRRRGEVVAMTGDGVNDALALKAAHVGIAMGKGGAEIARQAASLTLLNDDLLALGDAFESGRRVFDNLQKAIYYIIAIHIPVVGLVSLPVLLGWEEGTLFSPIHVIFLELLMGPTCSIVYESEPGEPVRAGERPRSLKDQFLSGPPLRFAILQGIAVWAAISLMVLELTGLNVPLEESRAMAFAALVFANIALTLLNRSKVESLLVTLRYKNPLVPALLLVSLLLLALTLFTPIGRHLFGFGEIGVREITWCLAVALAGTIWFEGVKWRRRILKARGVR